MIPDYKDVFLPNKVLFKRLKEYVETNSEIENVKVGRIIEDTEYPLIVFEEARNELETKSTTHDNTTRLLNYNINVYCSRRQDSYSVVIHLAELVMAFMQGIYNMDGGLIGVIPSFDDKKKISYQANLRFTCRYRPNKLKIY